MKKRDLSIPSKDKGSEEIQATEEPKQEVEETENEKKESEKLTAEEAEVREKVFFEEDEQIRLRDGRTYQIPPLALSDARRLMKNLNKIDSGVIISNFLTTEEGNDRYDDLLDVLLMAFKPYYPDMTVEYLSDYIDLITAKDIIDIMIGMNGLKKSM